MKEEALMARFANIMQLDLGWMFDISRLIAPRKVSQKERRKKARYRRSQGIKRRAK